MKIVRLLKVKDEIDVIEQNLKFYADQNIENIVLDTGSNDGTVEVCELGLRQGFVTKLGKITTDGFEREKILRELDKLCEQSSPIWVVVADADEFIETRENGVLLYEAITRENHQRNNLIQLANMEFWMTSVDNAQENDVLKRIQHYSFFPSQLFRIYKYVSGTSLVKYNNHAPEFPANHKVQLSDDLFILRHYKFRSLEQAARKIKKVVPEKENRMVGFHYIKFNGMPDNFVIAPERLHHYKEDKNWKYDTKFFGNRLNKEELKVYLGFTDNAQLECWFKGRNPFYREIHTLIGNKQGGCKNA
jgi:hypothetical protein